MADNNIKGFEVFDQSTQGYRTAKLDLSAIDGVIAGEVEPAVQEWLDEHPEATTTVQDGAIVTAKLADGAVTEPKIADAFLPYIKNAYVTPEMFGAVGDGAIDDSDAFNDALQYIAGQSTTETYEQTNIELWVTRKYNIGSLITIPDTIQNLTIRGFGGARIIGNGFYFDANTGHDVLFSGIKFIGCNNPISMAYRNSEYGSYTVEKCIFRSCTGVCVDIRRRSCFITVRDCFFKNNEKTAYIMDGDNFTFEHNWIERGGTVETGFVEVEHYCPNEGNAHIINNFFVPSTAQSNRCYWIRTGKDAEIRENRFSGENQAMNPVLVEYDRISSFDVNGGQYPIVNFVNNPMVHGKPAVVLGQFKGRLNIVGNSGYINGNSALIHKNSESSNYYDALDRKHFFLYLGQNAGRGFNRRDSLNNSPYELIPQNLIRFISKSEWGIADSSKNIFNPEFETTVNSNKLSIKFPYIVNVASQMTSFEGNGQFIVQGSVNKNPGGSGYYRQMFTGILSYDIAYSNSAVRVIPKFTLINGTNADITYTPTINGDADITYANASTAIQGTGLTLELTITSATSNQSVKYYTVTPMGSLERINNYRLL